MSDLDLDRADPRRVPGPRQRRQRRSAFARVFYSLFIALALAGIAAFALAAYGYSKYVAPGPLAANKIYVIDKGWGAPEIGEALAKEGIISDANLFAAAALLTGKRGRLKAGEYEFPKQASVEDVLNLVASGKAIAYKLTIPEGWTTRQALDRVNANEILAGELTAAPPEGAILPDTYVFKRGKTRDEIVADMVALQEKVIDELWRTRAPQLPIASKAEALTLASIVEKETGVAEERPLIAGVFVNRLKRKMRLQSDPTTIYGITRGQAKLDRPLSRADLAARTPYNTYQVDGLPPGPIANPGRAALEAVLNPATTTALYFVADGTGGHAFAATLDEHKANVVKWREIERNRGQAELAQAESEGGLPATEAPAATLPDPTPSTDAATLPDVAELPQEPAPNGAPETQAAADSATPDAAKISDGQVPAPEPKPFDPTPPPAAGKVPLPPEKPVETASAEVPAAEALKPGSVVKIAKRLVAIPVPKPKVQ